MDDSLSQLSGEGGLIDQIAKKAGPFESIKSLKPAIDLIRAKLVVKNVLSKQGGKEGVLDTETGTFTEKPFTSAEREQYESGSTGSGGVEVEQLIYLVLVMVEKMFLCLYLVEYWMVRNK